MRMILIDTVQISWLPVNWLTIVAPAVSLAGDFWSSGLETHLGYWTCRPSLWKESVNNSVDSFFIKTKSSCKWQLTTCKITHRSTLFSYFFLKTQNKHKLNIQWIHLTYVLYKINIICRPRKPHETIPLKTTVFAGLVNLGRLSL